MYGWRDNPVPQTVTQAWQGSLQRGMTDSLQGALVETAGWKFVCACACVSVCECVWQVRKAYALLVSSLSLSCMLISRRNPKESSQWWFFPVEIIQVCARSWFVLFLMTVSLHHCNISKLVDYYRNHLGPVKEPFPVECMLLNKLRTAVPSGCPDLHPKERTGWRTGSICIRGCTMSLK